MKKYIYLSSSLITAFLAYKYIYKQYKNILDYCYKIKDFKILKINNKLISVELNILFKNISDIEYKLKNLSTKIFIENFYLGEIKANELNTISNTSVEAKLYTDIYLNMNKDNIIELTKIITKYLNNKDELNFKFIINACVNVNFLKIPINIHIKNQETIYTYKELTTVQPSNCKV